MEKENKSIETPSIIVKVRKHHKQAYQYISNALKLDESHEISIAEQRKTLEEYSKGLAELELGMKIKLNASGDDFDRARKLQEKMATTLEHAQGRITDLRNSISEYESKESKEVKDIRDVKGNGSKKNIKKVSQRAPPKTFPVQKPINMQLKQPSTRKTAKPGPKQPTEDQTKKISNLKNVESKHANLILNEIVEKGRGVIFDDIGGMANAKQILYEIVILPALRPELFTGLRAPVRGLLLFGPPGNGKTLLAKAVATEANATFFNISAASLTSKWVGEGEKMVRAMFSVARELQPSIIFIDEIDSLLCERKESENEATRRVKTEFLVGFDGVISEPNERILIMGATNRPWELDDAALRRLVKRVQVPLPDIETRKEMIKKLLSRETKSNLNERDIDQIARLTDGYSGSDIAALARDAALMPVRELKTEQIKEIDADKVRGLNLKDFIEAMRAIRPSVSPGNLHKFDEWNSLYGLL